MCLELMSGRILDSVVSSIFSKVYGIRDRTKGPIIYLSS